MDGTRLTGKVAVVTGGAQGIGYATACRLLEQGCSVAIWDLDSTTTATAVEKLRQQYGSGREARPASSTVPGATVETTPELPELGVHVTGCECDVSNPSAVAAALDATVTTLGPVDILVNNAGFVRPGAFLDRPLEDWDVTVRVNLNGVITTCYAVLPGMRERGFGRVVNISSASGMLGVADLSVYAATKWAVWGFTESLRHEAMDLRAARVTRAAGSGGHAAGIDIRVSSVHPSYLKTGMFEGARIRGLGGLIVPLVKDHDVIARAIVHDAVIKGKPVVMRPRSIRLAVLLRGILPARVFDQIVRLLGIHRSMESFRGRGE